MGRCMGAWHVAWHFRLALSCHFKDPPIATPPTRSYPTKSGTPGSHEPPMHRCHARPSLPVVPEPNPTPPNIAPFELHDTAAHAYLVNPARKILFWKSIFSHGTFGFWTAFLKQQGDVILPTGTAKTAIYLETLIRQFLPSWTFLQDPCFIKSDQEIVTMIKNCL